MLHSFTGLIHTEDISVHMHAQSEKLQGNALQHVLKNLL